MTLYQSKRRLSAGTDAALFKNGNLMNKTSVTQTEAKCGPCGQPAQTYQQTHWKTGETYTLGHCTNPNCDQYEMTLMVIDGVLANPELEATA